ncbi:MAG: diacylglycerol kinase family lipid kinase [Lachnospiraceae bacterium]|nr:diacylglycerol kinase family lipid kinase [Lachnospiraceae bacterium]
MAEEAIHIIVNPTSRTGKTKEIWESIERELKAKEIPFVLHKTERRGHATEFAREISEEAAKEGKDKTIFLIGGDGTANEVVNGITDFKYVRFGYVPTGSGNDLGRGLGIKREPREQMMHLLSSTDELKMDLGEVIVSNGTHRKFTISSGIGLDATVCKQALTSKLKSFLNFFGLGSATYGILTVYDLFSMKVATGIVSYERDGKHKEINEKKMIVTVAMNHPWEGGGVPMCPKASASDGLLSMLSISNIPRLKTFLTFPKLVSGKHEGVKGFKVFKSEVTTVRLDTPMVIHADGEYIGTENEVTFKVLPRLLRVII